MRNPGPALPELREIVTDHPDWHYPSSCAAGYGIARLRVWAAARGGHVAVVTETGRGASVTNSIEHIHPALAMLYPGPLTLIEHWPAGQGASGEEHLDLAAVTSRGPAWSRIWPTPPANPHHDALDAWMARHGRAITAPG